MLRAGSFPNSVGVYVSHVTRDKIPARQPVAADDVARQVAEGSRAVVGVMLESFLVSGRQELGSGASLAYGQSITDACMDWETTVQVLDRLASAVRARRDGA